MTLTKQIVKDGNYLLELILKEEIKVAYRFIKPTGWKESYLNHILETLQEYDYVSLDPNNENGGGYVIKDLPSAEHRLKEGGLRNDYKTQKKESQISWPQRHWLLIAVVTFILTSIIAPLVVEKLKPTLLPAPTEGQLKFEETDSPNKDTTTVLPTAEPNIKSDTTNQ